MTAPVSAQARNSIEIDNSCNNCCPCFPRKKKHHIPRTPGSTDLSLKVNESFKKEFAKK